MVWQQRQVNRAPGVWCAEAQRQLWPIHRQDVPLASAYGQAAAAAGYEEGPCVQVCFGPGKGLACMISNACMHSKLMAQTSLQQQLRLAGPHLACSDELAT
jgi:hypothetical protein